MMVTLVLSSNMKRMMKDNVLVRKLVGIETAGSLNILFTDKTGTLTKGEIEVVGFMLGDLECFSSVDFVSEKYRKIFFESLFYNNEAVFDDGEVIGGNITDKAILKYIGDCRLGGKIENRVCFDSKNKYSMVRVKDGGKKYRFVKGASELLLKHCDRYLNQDGFKRLIMDKEGIYKKIDEVTSQGIRILCVAYGEGDGRDLDDLILLGFLFLRDDIRDEASEGVRLIQDAGIEVVMITGDTKGTAISIAREVGIVRDNNDVILSSDELSKMDDGNVREILPKLRVVYRAMPADKSRLVRIAQEENLVVGMTGDGVNDALALKKADVGFAMGSGTEVSKEASDIVIMDNNILSIEKAILYGRTIFKSIRKFIVFQLTVNLCAISISIIGPFIGIGAPVTVIQMLWINMVMDTLAGLAFSYEPAMKSYMMEKPKRRDEGIINFYMFASIMVMGIYATILCLFFLKSSFVKGIYRYSVDSKYLMTAFFGLFIFISIFNSFNARTSRLNILMDIFKNKVFMVVILLIVVVQVLMIYYGGSLFRTSGLNLKEFVVMILFSMTVIPVDFLKKLVLGVVEVEKGF